MKFINMRKGVALAVAAAAAASLAVVPSQAAALCAGPSTGGDWPKDGLDLQSTRNQVAEDKISADNVTGLGLKWTVNVRTLGGTSGTLQTMPIVSNGCVYLQVSTGSAFRLIALNADSGELVWVAPLAASGGMAAPHVVDGVVYVYEPTSVQAYGKGPHVLALDAFTGEEIYEGEGICSEPGCANNAGATSPAIFFDGLVWLGITNGETDGTRVGGYAIVDAENEGALIKRVHTVPDSEAAVGFGGCSIWSTPAIDPVTKHAYVGTGQPSTWTGKESERCNAIIKIDLDRSSPTFGEIVGAAKGTPDDAPYIDVDYGSGATLFRDADGRQLVAQQQKSGWMHAAYTRHMTTAWQTPTPGWGTAVGPFTKIANDGERVFTVGAYGAPLVAADVTTGLIEWASPVAAPAAQGAMATANGLVYFNDEFGILGAWDTETGVRLWARSMTVDNSACGHSVAGGVSVARHTVYSACGPVLAAYGLPA
jgi:polyvinyl alcohol dehydrogenase (cytochrome)